MSHDNEHLETSRQAVQTQSESLKENVKEKVKGQVIGSLMASDQKLSEAVNKSSAVSGYIPLGGDDVK